MERKGYLINDSTNKTEYFVLRSGLLRVYNDCNGGDVKNSIHMAFCAEVNLLPQRVIEVRSSAPFVWEYVLVAPSDAEAEGWYRCLQKAVKHEQESVRRNVDRLKAGAPLIKYNYSNSKRTRRMFWISSDGSELCWARQREDPDFSKVDLKECIGLIYGPMTTTFVRCERVDDPEWCCFSLLFMGRTLDLATPDGEEMIAPWFLGLQYLLSGTTPLMGDAQFLVRKAVLKLADAAHLKKLTFRTFLAQKIRGMRVQKNANHRISQASASGAGPPKPNGWPVANGNRPEDDLHKRMSALELELREAKLTAALATIDDGPKDYETAAVEFLRKQLAERDSTVAQHSEKVEQYDALLARSEKMEKAMRKMAKALEKNEKTKGNGEPDKPSEREVANAQKLEKQIEQLREQNKRLQSESDLQANDKQRSGSLKAEVDAKDAQIAELRSEIARVQKSEQAAVAKYRKAQNAKAAIVSGMEKVSAKVRDLKKAHKTLRAETDERLRKEVSGNSGGFAQIYDALGKLRKEKEELATKVKELSEERRKLHNQVLDLKGNIRVFCRVRPLIAREREEETATPTITFPDDDKVKVYNDADTRKKDFEFDRIFHPGCVQNDVFEEARPLATSVLDGYNVCIFAYGQTGAGKTFTMAGPKDDPGLNVRVVRELFTIKDNKRKTAKIDLRLSIMEIYNETPRDLLGKPGGSLDIKASDKEVTVPGLEEREVNSQEDVASFIAQADSVRAVEKTDMNEHSSRSHSIITLKARHQSLDTGLVYAGKIHLIDLAGSENVGKSGVTGKALTEAQNINKSLSALGDVMQSLQGKGGHVPYRNSKLTMLLKDSLGGNSKVLMLPHISPAQENVVETLSTLNFASRARQVELGKAKKNVSAS